MPAPMITISLSLICSPISWIDEVRCSHADSGRIESERDNFLPVFVHVQRVGDELQVHADPEFVDVPAQRRLDANAVGQFHQPLAHRYVTLEVPRRLVANYGECPQLPRSKE